jgi:hypothetical protein
MERERDLRTGFWFLQTFKNWNQNLYFQRTRLGTRFFIWFMHGTKTETGTGIFEKKLLKKKLKLGG